MLLVLFVKRKTGKKSAERNSALFISELHDIGDDNVKSFQGSAFCIQSGSQVLTAFLDAANEAERLSDLHTASQLHYQLWGLGISIGVTGLCQVSDKIVLTLSLSATFRMNLKSDENVS